MKNNIQVIAILLSITIGLSLSSFGNLSAQSNVPPSSKTYRKLNANTQTPSNDFYSTKALKSNDDDDLNPGGSEGGDGPFVGGTPIGEGLLPLSFIGLVYLIFITKKKFQKKNYN